MLLLAECPGSCGNQGELCHFGSCPSPFDRMRPSHRRPHTCQSLTQSPVIHHTPPSGIMGKEKRWVKNWSTWGQGKNGEVGGGAVTNQRKDFPTLLTFHIPCQCLFHCCVCKSVTCTGLKLEGKMRVKTCATERNWELHTEKRPRMGS